MAKYDQQIAQEQREEERKEQERQEQERQRFYRQINYHVMRKKWQAIRGRAKKGAQEQTIYFAFHMSRERYTNILRGRKVRISEEELRQLVAETGVRREIFEGKDHFQFDAISEREWKNLFALRDKIKDEEGDERKKKLEAVREYEKNLYGRIKESDVDILKNPDLYSFEQYLKRGTPATSVEVEADLKDKVQMLNNVSLTQLERCRSAVLQEYLHALEKQIDIAGTLLRYMKLKQQGQ